MNNGILFHAWRAVKTSAIGAMRYEIILHNSHAGASYYNYGFVVKCDLEKSLYMLRNRVHKLQPGFFVIIR